MQPLPHMAEVAAGLAYDKQSKRFLLVQRHPTSTVPSWSERWACPGGKIEGVETPEIALRRELWEEIQALSAVGTLLTANIYKTPGYPYPYRVRTYEVELTSVPQLTSAGGQDMKWFDYTECVLMNHSDKLLPGTMEAIQAFQNLFEEP